MFKLKFFGQKGHIGTVIVAPHEWPTLYFYSVLRSAYGGSHIVCWFQACSSQNQLVPGFVPLACLYVTLWTTSKNLTSKLTNFVYL